MPILLAIFMVLLAGNGPAASATDVMLAGQADWEKPWLPDLKNSGRTLPVPLAKRIDVVILGDGYLEHERSLFENDVQKWQQRFVTITPWRELRGVFRIRGLWAASRARVNAERKSHYHIGVAEGKVSQVKSLETSEAVFGALDRLNINRTKTGQHLTHAVVVLLLKDDKSRNSSGLSTSLTLTNKGLTVSIAVGADSHHEFGHAYGKLRDEYINEADSQANTKPVTNVSFRTASNLSYTPDLKLLPWAHLSPGSSVNPDRQSLIGILWLGGIKELGVWHSEARCLMNGSHENWDLGKTRRKVGLRDAKRFCFWCEEIVAARTFRHAGVLGDSDDEQVLWRQWEQLRPFYQRTFQVPERIRDQNAVNTSANLATAKIYARPNAN